MARYEPIPVSSTRNTAVNPNTVTNRFPRPYISKNDTLSLCSLSMAYNWFNVTTAFGNTTGCSYVWVDGVTHSVTYEPGNYSIENLSARLQKQMFDNGHYLVDAEGLPIYYLGWSSNFVYGAVTLVCSAVPNATLPAGVTNPRSVPLNGKVPQLVVGSTNWRTLIGFEPGSYPPTLSTVPAQYNSTVYPEISPVTIVNVTCSWLFNSQFSSSPALLYCFVPRQGFGETLFIEPANHECLRVMAGQYEEISVSFLDQNFRPLQMASNSQTQIALLLEHLDR